MKINYEAWEDGEFVITINGKPVGNTLSQRNAVDMTSWLKRTMPEILSIVKDEIVST